MEKSDAPVLIVGAGPASRWRSAMEAGACSWRAMPPIVYGIDWIYSLDVT
jgi:hypothetical protein